MFAAQDDGDANGVATIVVGDADDQRDIVGADGVVGHFGVVVGGSLAVSEIPECRFAVFVGPERIAVAIVDETMVSEADAEDAVVDGV